jgi:drug/metabolite transporter (DMT)-like permease
VTAVLGLAVLAIGCSAVIVRGMSAGPLAIAAWRTLGAALFLAPSAARALRPTAREGLALVCAGACLAGHFALWFASLGSTSVLRSTVLVCLTPVWTGLLEMAVDRRIPPGRFWVGVAVALGGVAAMTTTGGGGSWRGDALAILAGLLWPIYLVLGRGFRRRAGTAPAMGAVCAVAAALLWPVALLAGEPLWGWGATTWALIALAIALPQLVGHQGMSYAVGYVPPSTVAAATLLEPVVASALSAVVLREIPTSPQVVGGGIVLVGVWICLAKRPSSSGMKPAPAGG